MLTIEFRVIPVTRYIVTRYAEETEPGAQTASEKNASNSHMGEFENETQAFSAVRAFGDSETMRAGAPDKVITHLPARTSDTPQTRTWTQGEGWHDAPVLNEQKIEVLCPDGHRINHEATSASCEDGRLTIQHGSEVIASYAPGFWSSWRNDAPIDKDSAAD